MANKRYIKISVNLDIPEDKQIYDILASRSNMSGYIKRLILEDSNGQTTEQAFLQRIIDVITKTIDDKLSDKYTTDAEGEGSDPGSFLFRGGI